MSESVQTVPPSPAAGLPVLYCVPGSAAFCSGVRPGDVIIEVNGVPITDAEVYLRVSRESGGDMRLTLNRAGRTFEVQVSLEAHRRLKVNVAQLYSC